MMAAVKRSRVLGHINPTNFTGNAKICKNFLIKPNEEIWNYNDGQKKQNSRISEFKLKTLLEKGKLLYEKENAQYEGRESRKGAEGKIMGAIMKSGTISDRLTAISLRVVKAPLHNFELFVRELYEKMALKKNRRLAITAINAMSETLIGILPCRKLIFFSDRTWDSDEEIPDEILVRWYFENRVKLFVFKYIRLLETYSNDVLPEIRIKTLQHIYKLLSSKPEQEKNALILIISKFSDTCNKVSSKAVYLLQTFVNSNPETKMPIVKLIDSLIISKPTVSINTIYVSLTYLTQTIFSSSGKTADLATYLVNIYVNLLKRLVNMERENSFANISKKSSKAKSSKAKSSKAKSSKAKSSNVKASGNVADRATKIYSAIFTGIYRAFPYAVDVDTDSLLSIVDHLAQESDLRYSVKALSLFLHICFIKCIDLPCKFYITLYNFLLKRELIEFSKIADMSNLIYRTLKFDYCLERVTAFVKRILQLCYSLNESSACVLMHVIYTLINEKRELLVLITHPEDHSSVPNASNYNLLELDPSKSHADKTCLWELCVLQTHFHPTIVKYANLIVNFNPSNKSLPKFSSFPSKHYDPLHCNTLIRFLDKITQKPPKSTKTHVSTLLTAATSDPKSKNRLYTPIVKSTTNMLPPETIALLDAVISFQNYKSFNEATLDPVEKCVYTFFKNTDQHQLLHTKRPPRGGSSDQSDVESDQSDAESDHSDAESDHSDQSDVESDHSDQSDVEGNHSDQSDVESDHSDAESDHSDQIDAESDHSAPSDGEPLDNIGNPPNIKHVAKRAKTLGYKGAFFDNNCSQTQDYASLSDFEDLIE